MRACTYECKRLLRPEEGVKSPGVGVAGGYKSFDKGTQVLWKSTHKDP